MIWTSVFFSMQYRGIEYQVVQTADPMGWKWTVLLDNERIKTGAGYNRASAIALAQRAIDKVLAARGAGADGVASSS